MQNTNISGKDSQQITNQMIDQRVKSTNAKTTVKLENGINATTLQGGMEVPIMFKEVLAGEYIKDWKVENITRILTPLVPTMDKIYATITAWFVPHTRVWKDAEKFLAGKTDYNIDANSDETNITTLPTITINDKFTQNFFYKNSLAGRYGIPNKSNSVTINPLLMRGYRAIENDFLRIKQYEPAKVEWNETEPTTAEQNAMNYITTLDEVYTKTTNPNAYVIVPAKARNSYYTNIKKNMYDNTSDNEFKGILQTGMQINKHLDWQNQYNDQKQRTDNAEKNDWDIIAEMGGTQPVVANQVQLLGKIDYELNYQQITQSSPEINESSPLGTTGSFSYTKANGTLFSHKQFNQHGFIHILINVNIDMNLERGINKELLKSNILDIYRPGMAEKETQILMLGELNASATGSNISWNKFLAYQPAWAEYKRMPKMFTGEMQTDRLLPLRNDKSQPETITNSQWHNAMTWSDNVMSPILLRPAYLTNLVLARNNVMNSTFAEGLQFSDIYFYDDPIMNMSEHKVTVSLPIPSHIINQTEKAETKQ